MSDEKSNSFVVLYDFRTRNPRYAIEHLTSIKNNKGNESLNVKFKRPHFFAETNIKPEHFQVYIYGRVSIKHLHYCNETHRHGQRISRAVRCLIVVTWRRLQTSSRAVPSGPPASAWPTSPRRPDLPSYQEWLKLAHYNDLCHSSCTTAQGAKPRVVGGPGGMDEATPPNGTLPGKNHSLLLH